MNDAISPVSPSVSPLVNYQEKTLPNLKKWKSQHKIKKLEGIGIKNSLIRISVIVTAIALSPLLLTAGLLVSAYKGWTALKGKISPNKSFNNLKTAVKEMKQEEQQQKLNTMKETMQKTIPDAVDNSSIQGNQSEINKTSPKEVTKQQVRQTTQSEVQDLTKNLRMKLEDKEHVIAEKHFRHLTRELARLGEFKPEWMNKLKELAKNPEAMKALAKKDEGIDDFYKEVENIEGRGNDPEFMNAVIGTALESERLTGPQWEKTKNKVENLSEKDIQEFENSLTDMLMILKGEDSKDPSSTNRDFIQAYRKVLASPVYQVKKEDSSDPAILLLHRFAAATWNQVQAMDAYQKVGEDIQKIMNEAGIATSEDIDFGKRIADLLEKSHEKMAESYYTNESKVDNLHYTIYNTTQALGALDSEGGVARQLVFGGSYDPHGQYANNPSLQGTTTFETDIGEVKVLNCYGGSPTIGDYELSPEFEALLQAAENNQFRDEPDELIPTDVNYNNLQNLDKSHGENERSHTIMLANHKYPLSFHGMTLSKDSPFYKGEEVKWESPEQFGNAMKEQLMKAFDPNAKNHGFYFPGGKEKWEPIFNQVIEETTKHFENVLSTENAYKPEELQGAYQEHVYAMLIAINELVVAKNLQERGIKAIILQITACKENIDRGGAENAKYLYLRLDDGEENKENLIVGAMHSRALSARNRLILSHRMDNIVAFMKMTEPSQFREGLEKIAADLGVAPKEETFKYQPHTKTAAAPKDENFDYDNLNIVDDYDLDLDLDIKEE